jgi:hypothetical protein
MSSAEVVDKVVAFVDTEAITLSEVNESHETMVQLSPGITHREVLNTMINRLLLIREARRLRLEATDEDRLLDEYIDMKVRAFIKIKESAITDFYESNIAEFEDKSYAEVKDDIEAYLLEKEVNYRIRKHLDSLKEKAHIKILLEAP